MNLLRAGLSPDTLLDGVSPLELALHQFDDGLGEPDAVRTDVLRSVVAAGPRDICQATHNALAKPTPIRLIALLRAGAELDARDATGQSLAARAMRRDDDSRGDAATDWTDLLIREGHKPPPALCAWILLWAASTNRVRLVERLLAADVPIDASLQGSVPSESVHGSEIGFWWPGGTSLHRLLARAEGPNAMMYAEADLYSPEMLRVLLRHGASTNAINGIGRTPLHIAAREGLEEAATAFMRIAETDLTRRDADGETILDSALHWPRSGGIARKLLARGLPPDPAYQARILHRAVYNRDLDFLRGVLDAGIDPNAVSEDVHGALMVLAHNWNFLIPTYRRSCIPCLTLLLERSADVSLRDSHGWTALHWLAMGEEVDAIDRLLAAGIDPNIAGNEGRTALMNCNSPAMAERLLAAGAQQSMRDSHGFDALDHATIYGRTGVAELLRAPECAPSREAALIRAIMDRNELAVVDLLAAEVAPDTVDPAGRPLLHVAANILSPEMLLLLLDRGAAVDARDALGHTALDECLNPFKGGNEDYERCVTLLLDRGATTESVNALDDRGEAAIFRGYRFWHVPSIATRLLSAGRDARRRDGTTALMAAVERGSPDHVAYLLRAGLDARAVNGRGRTALHYLARGSGDEMEYRDKALLLLRAGAAVDASDNNGETPLMASVAASNHNMIDFFLDQGADPERSNAAGESLLRIALRTRDVSLVNRFGALP
ncbi:ankyrin repeat domain-containing protein [Acidisoma sp. S159]|uniref:ankyrin repeat domain-containing protein n=1 Tax=Acidisoma sp. S159 TaxID=1747225 RepID=UPI0020B159FB|nr:ankyrin repeat domain-containing protein [Acidisoma sp. S159]